MRELSVEGFRGIRRLARPLRLEKLNVLIGRNDAGKTSILEALFLLSEPYMEPWESEAEKWKRELYLSIYRKPASAAAYISGLHGSKSPSTLIYGYAGGARLSYVLDGNIEVSVEITSEAPISFPDKGKALRLLRSRPPALFIPDSTDLELEDTLARGLDPRLTPELEL